MPVPSFILASHSPRRLALLRQIGVVPDLVVPADLTETPLPRELPAKLASRLAKAKAMHGATLHPGAVVLGADTVVACGRRVLPKAESLEEAHACLQLLSGRRHRVHTGICVIDSAGRAHCRLVTSQVRFKRLGVDEMTSYLASGEWQGKAGGYAIQGRADQFVHWINGSYSNIVGLPLYETAMLLKVSGLEF